MGGGGGLGVGGGVEKIGGCGSVIRGAWREEEGYRGEGGGEVEGRRERGKGEVRG